MGQVSYWQIVILVAMGYVLGEVLKYFGKWLYRIIGAIIAIAFSGWMQKREWKNRAKNRGR